MRRQAIKTAIQSAQMQPYLKNATGYRTMMKEAPVRRVIASRNKAENFNYGNSARSEGEYFLGDSSRRRSVSMPSNDDRLDLLEVKNDIRFPRGNSNLCGSRKDLRLPVENDLGELKGDFRSLNKKNSGNESALVRSAKTAFINRSKKTQPSQSWLGDERLLVIDNELKNTIKKEKTEKLKMKPESTDMNIKSFRKDGKNIQRLSKKCSLKPIEKPSGNKSTTKKYDKNVRSSPSNMRQNSSIHNRGTSSLNQTKGVHAKNTQWMTENNLGLPVQIEKRTDLNEYGVRIPKHGTNLRANLKPVYNGEASDEVTNDKFIRSYEQYKDLGNENKGHKMQFETKSCSENYRRNTPPVYNTGKSDYMYGEEWLETQHEKNNCKFMKKAHDLSDSIKRNNRMYNYEKAKYSTEMRNLAPVYNSEPSDNDYFVQKYDRINKSSIRSPRYRETQFQRKNVQPENQMEFEKNPSSSEKCRAAIQQEFTEFQIKYEKTMKIHSQNKTQTSDAGTTSPNQRNQRHDKTREPWKYNH